jgi:hypothetical protein
VRQLAAPAAAALRALRRDRGQRQRQGQEHRLQRLAGVLHDLAHGIGTCGGAVGTMH